jgi:hypothetical protein
MAPDPAARLIIVFDVNEPLLDIRGLNLCSAGRSDPKAFYANGSRN